MTVKLGQPAPDFTMPSIRQGEGIPRVLKLEDYRGKWLILFFYPFDFSSVCPTEILSMHHRLDEFHKLNTEVIGVSTDSIYSHKAWVRAPRDANGIGELSFPLASDYSKETAAAYGVLDEKTSAAQRGLFIIDPEGIVQYIVITNMNVGRSTDETLRVLEALQSGGLCPMDWKPGQATLK
ncbi:peroxiredoxin [Paenibacillus sp. y28]|uniref:peroxiredoxin n=1 Tax=Paenibacillus sp. y28 TaxID=3129110 RepID=UPI0030162B1C